MCETQTIGMSKIVATSSSSASTAVRAEENKKIRDKINYINFDIITYMDDQLNLNNNTAKFEQQLLKSCSQAEESLDLVSYEIEKDFTTSYSKSTDAKEKVGIFLFLFINI